MCCVFASFQRIDCAASLDLGIWFKETLLDSFHRDPAT